MEPNTSIAILGCGNLGLCIAKGIVNAKVTPANKVTITRRNLRYINFLSNSFALRKTIAITFFVLSFVFQNATSIQYLPGCTCAHHSFLSVHLPQ